AEAIDYGTSVEAGSKLAFVKVNVHDITDVTIVDLLVVVVLDLHDLVAGCEGPAESLDLTFAGRIQGRLQFDVERARTNSAPVGSTSSSPVDGRASKPVASCLATPRPSRDHQHLGRECQRHGRSLAFGEYQAGPLLDPGDRLIRINRGPGQLAGPKLQ